MIDVLCERIVFVMLIRVVFYHIRTMRSVAHVKTLLNRFIQMYVGDEIYSMPFEYGTKRASFRRWCLQFESF